MASDYTAAAQVFYGKGVSAIVTGNSTVTLVNSLGTTIKDINEPSGRIIHDIAVSGSALYTLSRASAGGSFYVASYDINGTLISAPQEIKDTASLNNSYFYEYDLQVYADGTISISGNQGGSTTLGADVGANRKFYLLNQQLNPAITSNGAFTEGVTLTAGAITSVPSGSVTSAVYQWYLNGSAISGANSATYAVSATGTGTYKVTITNVDAQGYSSSMTSADQAIAKIDNGQGSVAISGTSTVGSVLTASAVTGDPEGLASSPAYTYTWLRNGAIISGATSSSYTLSSADLGSQISVGVGYTDSQGYTSTVLSAPTVAISTPPAYQVVLQATTGTNTDMPLGDGTSIRLSDGTLVLASNKDMGLVSAPYGGGDILGKGVISFINPTTGAKTRSDITFGTGKTIINGIAATPDNGFIVYGGAKESLYGSAFGGALDSFVIKYDSSGNFQWIQSFKTNLHEYIAGASADAAGNIYISGRTSYDLSEPRTFSSSIIWYGQSLGSRYYAAFSGKLTAGGALSYVKVYGGLSGGMAVSADNNGSLAVIYTGVNTNPSNYTYFNSSGSAIWSRDVLARDYTAAAQVFYGKGVSAIVTGNSTVTLVNSLGTTIKDINEPSGRIIHDIAVSGSALYTLSRASAGGSFYVASYDINGTLISAPQEIKDTASLNNSYFYEYDLQVYADGTISISGNQGGSTTLGADVGANRKFYLLNQQLNPAITSNGAFTEGVTLTAGAITSVPSGSVTSAVYQWYLNGSAISGANSATYAVSATGTGTYKVTITNVDAQGYSSSMTSADQAIAKIDNGQGSLSNITGNGAFNEGVTLSAGSITGDPDGAATPSAYQWYLNGSAITGATAATYAVSATGFGTYKVAVTYADAQGYSATLTSADQAVAKIDNGQGSIAITGTTTVGSVLSASAVSGDPEGLASAPAYTYIWLRNGSPISGATNSSYPLTTADLGSQISVRVGYTDSQGYVSTTTSGATASISTPPDTISPTVTTMAVQENTITLTFSEPITGSSLSTANYVVAVAGTSRAISTIGFDATANNKLLLILSGTAPTATQSLTVAYTLPAGTPGSSIVTDLAGNPLQSFTARAVDTFVSASAIGTSSAPLQAGYLNATLSGTSSVGVYANSQNNTISGNDVSNALYGAAGNDSINGKAGNDSLYGGDGIDSLTGGLGSDSFFFDVKPATFSASTVDHITDFNTNQSDKISFSKSAYGFSSTTVSLLTISNSTQLSSALATSNVFIYDGSQGLLYWNQNGITSGSGTGGIVAVLDAQAGVYPLLAASNLAIA